MIVNKYTITHVYMMKIVCTLYESMCILYWKINTLPIRFQCRFCIPTYKPWNSTFHTIFQVWLSIGASLGALGVRMKHVRGCCSLFLFSIYIDFSLCLLLYLELSCMYWFKFWYADVMVCKSIFCGWKLNYIDA